MKKITILALHLNYGGVEKYISSSEYDHDEECEKPCAFSHSFYSVLMNY